MEQLAADLIGIAIVLKLVCWCFGVTPRQQDKKLVRQVNRNTLNAQLRAQQQAPANALPAGWYPDPSDPAARLLYWDGQNWGTP